MSPDSQDFEALRRLLALKRYEQPPPGYFVYFSRRVVARIEAGARGDDPSWLHSLFAEASWLQRFWAALETKPVLVGAFGALVCGLFISGMIYSQGSALAADSQNAPQFADIFQPLSRPAVGTLTVLSEPFRSASTEPMLFPQQRGSLFDPQYQFAGFQK